MSVRIEQTTARRAGAVEAARREASAGVVVWQSAPFSLRCGALLIDYTLIVSVVAFTTIISRMMGGGSSRDDSVLMSGYLIAVGLAALDFIVLPLLTGLTLGKWATGLRLVRSGDGRTPTLVNVLLRHTVGYLLTLLTLGIGFLLSVFNAKGRALHDLVGGTVVVRRRGHAGGRLR